MDNTNFARLISGYPSFAPDRIRSGSTTIYNPTADQYIQSGYLPVTYSDQPETDPGYYASPVWTDTGTAIVQSWEILPEPEQDPTLEEQLEAQAEAIEELAEMLAEVLNG